MMDHAGGIGGVGGGGPSPGTDAGRSDEVRADRAGTAQAARLDQTDLAETMRAEPTPAERAAGQARLEAEGRRERERFERRAEAGRMDAGARAGASPAAGGLDGPEADPVTPGRITGSVKGVPSFGADDAALAQAAALARGARAPAPGDWTPEERAALDRGAAQGAVDAGRGWAAELMGGVVQGATTAGQAAVVALDRAARPPAPTGNGLLDGLNRVLREANPLSGALDLVDALIPDAFADRQAASLRAKGEAFVEEMRALPEVPAAVREKLEADLALADALEEAYQAGRADLSALEESARVRARALTEAGILAAELGSVAAGGAGAGLKLARGLAKLDLGDVPGGALGALGRAGEVGRSLAQDVRAFARDERAGATLGLEPGERLDRATLDLVEARRSAHARERAHRIGDDARAEQMLGARAMRPGEWNALEREAAELGATVERLPPARFAARVEAGGGNPQTARGAFDPSTGALVLRQDATPYEAFHELQHARHWAEVGSEEFGALSRYEKEAYVRDAIFARGGRFSPVERGHAMDYVYKVAQRDGMVREEVDLPATASRADYEAYLRRTSPTGSVTYDEFRALDEIFGR